MKPAERVKRQLLELGILTLITVIVWIAYGVYSALTEPAEVSVTDEELRALSTDIDFDTLDLLKSSLAVTEDDFRQLSARPVVSFPIEEIDEATSSATESASTP
jgi:hypothetical protein